MGVGLEDGEGVDGGGGEEVGADFFGEAFGAVEHAAGADDLELGGDADVVEEVDELADHGGAGGDGAVDHEDLGLELVQKRITRDEIYIADEAFFTGTAAEVTPIRELDRVQIGAGARGPVTEKIQAAFFDIVNGRNPKYAHWLAKV